MEAHEAEADTTSELTDAATMLHDFTLPALAGVRRKVAQAAEDETTLPWRLLIELIHDQLTHDLARLEAVLPSQAFHAEQAKGTVGVETFEASVALRETLICRSCGEAFESDPVLAEMRQRLATAGVSGDHLSICQRCRDDHDDSSIIQPPDASLKAWQ
jgi:hypothetical protein